MKALIRFAVLALLATPSTALANDYLSGDSNDWFRYTNSRTGQQVTAKIEREYGNWKLWNDWSGMGPTWVYSSDQTRDFFWLWNGQTYMLMANLNGQVGEQRMVDLNCNRGPVTIVSRGALTTPAGNFSNVVQLGLTPSCADAGVTNIWVAEGVGIVKYSYQSLMGEQTLELDTAMVGGNMIGGTPAAPSTPTAGTGADYAPPEHVDMEAILWGANDTYLVTETYRDAFRGLNGSGVLSDVNVTSQNVASQLRYEMAQANVPMDDVEIYVVALDSVWMRDYGPIVMKRADGSRYVADLEYYGGRPRDDVFPRAYGQWRGWNVVDVEVGYEGGNFFSDGRGLQILSNGTQWFNRDKSKAGIEREFGKLGSNEFVWLEPLIDEGTTHVDMFVRTLSDDVALVSNYPTTHRQRRIVDEAANKLRAKGYRIVRAEADYTYDEYASYTNSVTANGIALVPQYRNSSRNAAALQVYRDAGYRAVGIESQLIIKYSGATHCLSMQVPR